MTTRGTSAARVDLDRDVAGASHPVMLATMGVPFDQAAASFAVDSAVESGQDLIVVNVTRLEPVSLSVRLGYDSLEEFTPEVSDAVRAQARLARSCGVRVELLRVRSPRPVQALLELVAERLPGLLVFGPDRNRLSARRYRKAAVTLRSGAGCLVWLPD